MAFHKRPKIGKRYLVKTELPWQAEDDSHYVVVKNVDSNFETVQVTREDTGETYMRGYLIAPDKSQMQEES